MESAGYFSEPFCRNAAWFDLILLANHDENYFRARGIRITVKRGQVGYGMRELSKRWRWSRGKVERFMKELEFDKKIVRQKNNVTTLISLVNYSKYNSNDTTDKNPSEQQAENQTGLNKNDKNVKNGKKYIHKKRKKDVLADTNTILLIDFAFEDEAFKEKYLRWVDHLTAKGKRPTEATIIEHMQFLKEYEVDKAIQIIGYSLNGGYPVLYEPKENGKQSNSPGSETTRSVTDLLS